LRQNKNGATLPRSKVSCPVVIRSSENASINCRCSRKSFLARPWTGIVHDDHVRRRSRLRIVCIDNVCADGNVSRWPNGRQARSVPVAFILCVRCDRRGVEHARCEIDAELGFLRSPPDGLPLLNPRGVFCRLRDLDTVRWIAREIRIRPARFLGYGLNCGFHSLSFC